MQIILTQKELEEAVHNFINERVSFDQGAIPTVALKFEDDTILAFISTDGEDEAEQDKPEPVKQTRAPRTRKATTGIMPSTAVAAAEPETETKPEEPTEAGNASEPDAPWEEGDKNLNPPAAEAVEAPEATPVEPVATAAPLKIFPDATTSAAPATKEPAPPASAAKSLFANLTKPVHDSQKD